MSEEIDDQAGFIGDFQYLHFQTHGGEFKAGCPVCEAFFKPRVGPAFQSYGFVIFDENGETSGPIIPHKPEDEYT